jgi:hypothetical protein
MAVFSNEIGRFAKGLSKEPAARFPSISLRASRHIFELRPQFF